MARPKTGIPSVARRLYYRAPAQNLARPAHDLPAPDGEDPTPYVPFLETYYGLPVRVLPADRGNRFLFGRARFFGRNDPPRVAVVSSARLQGDFLRMAKLLAHETGHLFGLAHCVYYRCLMNGSAHLAEADARPVNLCPVCLRKLGTAVRFDPEKRMGKLKKDIRNE